GRAAARVPAAPRATGRGRSGGARGIPDTAGGARAGDRAPATGNRRRARPRRAQARPRRGADAGRQRRGRRGRARCPARQPRARRLRGELDFARALDGAPPREELEARIARDPADFAARDLLGVRLLIGGEAEAALEQFLHILRADRHWNDDQARKRLVAAFQVIPDEDLVGTYRRRMSSLLF